MYKKKFQKEYRLPLPGKITILGMHIETKKKPQQEASENLVTLKDYWNIQIIYRPYDSDYQTSPSLLEFPVSWEQEIELSNYNSGEITFTYPNPPKSISTLLQEEPISQFFLRIIIEGTVEVIISNNNPSIPTTSVKYPTNVPKKIRFNINKLNTKLNSLEEQNIELHAQLSKMSERIYALEESTPEKVTTYSRITGYILDSFRLLPLAKTIIEFRKEDEQSPPVKIASDNRGFYFCDKLIPGTYEIKIKHPRFSPLIIKEFPINEGDNKYQDFLLNRL
ncbi:MAG: hypothetical protein CVU87_02605 [Firmicutes bacterium HGW-Firmicutes-12]|nr:MAG: hypothetical protein CVU87_02605 [Firmicutes bacterium HGW-Firmicutes-12]